MKTIIMVAIAALAYLLIIVFNQRKTWFALAAGLLVLALGLSAPQESWLESLRTGLLEHLNWNVMMIYLGSLLAAEFFILSGIPAKAAEAIAESAPSAGVAIALIALFTGLISAFVENVATLLVMAPIAIELARKMKVPLSPVLIILAVSSNLQGTATLIGDPPSMIFAAERGYGFMDFFFFKGKPSIFFFVEFGALIATFVTILLFRKYRDKPAFHMEKPIKSWIPLVFLVFMVLGLSLVTSIFPDFHYGTGLVCMATGLAGVVWYLASGGGRTGLGELVKSLDWDSMAFLAGIFVMLGGLSASGALEALARIMGPVAEAGPLALFAITVAISVLVSGFVDNVPYIILMLPVIASLTDPASGLANAEVLSRSRTLIDFGLLIGACLGGNVTPFGASANVVAMGLARKNGEKPTSWTFLRIGIPFTVITTLAAALAVWLVWKP